MKFQAAIHGVDIEKDSDKRHSQDKGNITEKTSEHKRPTENQLFRDPKDYEKMTAEDRQKMTDNMTMYLRNKMSKALGGQ